MVRQLFQYYFFNAWVRASGRASGHRDTQQKVHCHIHHKGDAKGLHFLQNVVLAQADVVEEVDQRRFGNALLRFHLQRELFGVHAPTTCRYLLLVRHLPIHPDVLNSAFALGRTSRTYG